MGSLGSHIFHTTARKMVDRLDDGLEFITLRMLAKVT
jgi:hypothetical protein